MAATTSLDDLTVEPYNDDRAKDYTHSLLIEDNANADTLPTLKDLSNEKSIVLAKKIILSALPAIIQFFSALFVNNTTFHLVSQKNDITLYNGMSLAMNILNCFSFYIIFHTNVGFNAATSQAIGAKDYKLVGLYLHRAFILQVIFGVIGYGILCGAPFVFGLAGVNNNLTQIAFNYLVFCPGYILGVIIFDTLKNYLYAHEIFTPLVFIQGVIAVAYWFLGSYLFIKRDMGIIGLNIAITSSQLLGALALVLYVFIAKPKQIKHTWTRLEKESFKDLWPLAKIMIGVGAMGYVEVLAYRIQSFASMYFAGEQVAALTAFLALGDMFYVFPAGISFPIITYIGEAMGARNKKAVKKIIKVTLVISLFVLAAQMAAFVFLRDYMFAFYTNDANVRRVMETMGMLYFFTYPADFAQTILAGVIKGTGREKIGTKAFLAGLYLVSLPCALVLALHFKLEAPGVWFGNGIGLYFSTVFFAIIVSRTNFEKQFDFISARMKKL